MTSSYGYLLAWWTAWGGQEALQSCRLVRQCSCSGIGQRGVADGG